MVPELFHSEAPYDVNKTLWGPSSIWKWFEIITIELTWSTVFVKAYVCNSFWISGLKLVQHLCYRSISGALSFPQNIFTGPPVDRGSHFEKRQPSSGVTLHISCEWLRASRPNVLHCVLEHVCDRRIANHWAFIDPYSENLYGTRTCIRYRREPVAVPPGLIACGFRCKGINMDGICMLA